MPAPMMGPGPSGMDTSATIQQLMKLERVPIQRIQEENKEHELMIQAWEEVRNLTRDLEQKSRELYSFAGPFAVKKIESSDPGAITGEASPRVQDTNQTMEVVQLAGNHQIHSSPISSSDDLPAGEFVLKVGDREHRFNFRGGSLHSLVQLLEGQAGADYEVFEVRVDSENSLLGFRSKTSGERGKLRFEDPNGLLRSIGLIGELPASDEAKPLSLRRDSLSPYSGSPLNSSLKGSYAIDKKGDILHIKGDLALRLNRKLPAASTLMLQVESDDTGKGEGRNAPSGSDADRSGGTQGRDASSSDTVIHEKMTVGPEISLDVEDVHLEGYNIERSRERRIPGVPGQLDGKSASESGPDTGDGSSEEALKSSSGGLILFWDEDGSEKSRVIPLSQLKENGELSLKEITGGKDVQSMVFYSRTGTVSFRDLKLREGAGGGVGPLHVTEEGRDAKLRVNGVEISRPSNKGITDIIDGVRLDLNRVTSGPVQVNVKADTDKIVAKIHEWVDTYNKLLRFLKDNNGVGDAKEFKMKRPGNTGDDLSEGLRKLKAGNGVFATDSTVRKLVYTLREITGNSYPAGYEPAFHVLNDVGISTGGAGKSWEEIKKGLLEVDDEKLIQALSRSSASVKELFASDTNEDTRVDNGVAFRLADTLRAYTRVSGGLISVRIDLLKTKISDNKERIDRLELSLKSKEESLRQRFGRMEEAIRQSRATGNYLKNNLRAPSGE